MGAAHNSDPQALMLPGFPGTCRRRPPRKIANPRPNRTRRVTKAKMMAAKGGMMPYQSPTSSPLGRCPSHHAASEQATTKIATAAVTRTITGKFNARCFWVFDTFCSIGVSPDLRCLNQSYATETVSSMIATRSNKYEAQDAQITCQYRGCYFSLSLNGTPFVIQSAAGLSIR